MIIKSPINYTGNKYRLIEQIQSLFPSEINTFVDVFGGSGTVLLNTKANKYIYNDYSTWVSKLFETIIHTDTQTLLERIDSIIDEYSLSKFNFQGFLDLREYYNNHQDDWIMLYVLCCYAFNSQGRFGSNGKFNMPFGKERSQFSTVQRRNITNLKTIIGDKDVICYNKSFEDLDYHSLSDKDFVYFDPPYFGSVAVYNERGGWTKELEEKLMNVIYELDNNNIKFALSNNLKYNNAYLQELATKFNTHHLGSIYTNCSYHKKFRSVDDEVLITNY